MDIREKRKWDHVKKTIAAGINPQNFFDDVVLIPDASASVSLSEINTECKVFTKIISAPLMINAMTGGAQGLDAYNYAFAKAAAENNIAMAVGSQKSGVDNPSLEDTYKIARKTNPDGVLIANLSALEKIETMQRAVSMIEADAIQLHVNHGQELSMKEGDRDFSNLLKNIETAVRKLQVPVIVKEVGSGISKKAARNFIDAGVIHFDVSGYGGTNFAAIEESRSDMEGNDLSGIGIPTPVSILEVKSLQPPGLVVASGGIKSSADVVKSLALGADMAAMAGSLLMEYETKGTEALSQKVAEIIVGIRKLFLVLGIKKVKESSQINFILKNEVREWMLQR